MPVQRVVSIVRDYFVLEKNVVSVFLFGSLAKGTSRSTSDVDLAILFSNNSRRHENFLKRLDYAGDLELALGGPVDIIDLIRAEPILVHQVFLSCKIIMDQDPEKRIKFQIAHRRLYFDLLPFYRHYYEQALIRLKGGLRTMEKIAVVRRLTVLEECLRDLAEVTATTPVEEFRGNKMIQRYTERTLHMAIEACLDLANQIIAYKGFREPKSLQDYFEILAEQGLVEGDLKTNLKRMGQFRELLVHDYTCLNPDNVYQVVQNHTEHLRKFANKIKDTQLPSLSAT